MYQIIKHAYQHAFNYKTNKSIYNILMGKKSHQTFFDACSQQLLSLYHSLPRLKYPSFERYLNELDIYDALYEIKMHPRFTYDSLIKTFNCIQLLIQTVSQSQHQAYKFVPVAQQTYIQQRVKDIYKLIREQQLETQVYNEIHQLFDKLASKNDHIYLHYYLQGYEEPMYTRQQVSLIESISQEELFELEMNQLVDLMYELENNNDYPTLHQTIILPTLLNKTKMTYRQIQQGQSPQEIATIQNVKINTIEDHLLELFIKGYMHDYETFIDLSEKDIFINYYSSNIGLKLREYKQQFSKLSYFQIKLMIVGIERGDIVATREA
ncbi:helix-turn-helix domain-containing protein [Staphylococcus pasteuri]|uniref:helix-turn-helix domain-containing protein n=1 Tax=Staphylococcus pasteuri TaxID=45972 RepID=UPI000E67A1F2|nr:helix-turn-helix domain-containing protein [Staphylococcus pasteuri]MCT1925880.1 helix-turn-helix domain-containing protein [Staphylococcus pasteuri]QQT11429.1 helix-turn-helix domain-containing protein [Staphylococcus pasteuri]RIO51442.1 hypothetical protein BUZ64_08355 [Staphylococcus pasteuri]